jgi:hypothetical protein
VDDYAALHALDAGAIVVDAGGEAWLVTKHGGDETWLCPFSDEYAFTINADGTTVAMGHAPLLPIRELTLETRQ